MMRDAPNQTAGGRRGYLIATVVGVACLGGYLGLTTAVGGEGAESPVAGIARWLAQYERGRGLEHDAENLAHRGLEYALILLLLLPAWLLLAGGIAGLLGGQRTRKAIEAFERHAGAIAIAAALFAFGASLAISSFVFQQQPITEGDEYCYTFQAELFASGRLHTDVGAGVEELENRAIVTTGPWRYGIGFPGHPLLLVPGVLVGWISLVPAVLAAGSVLLLFLTAKALFGRLTGAVAAVLLATSPFFLFFHGTLLPQPSIIFCLLLFTFAVVKLVQTEHLGWLALALGSLLVATVVRVPSVMLWVTPLLAYTLLIRRRPRGRWFLVGTASVAAVAVGTGLLIWFAAEASGRPAGLRLAPRPEGMRSYTEGYTSLAGGVASADRIKLATVNTAKRLAQINLMAFGFPVSFLLALLWIFRSGKSGWEWMFLAIIAAYGIFYFLYTDPNPWYYLDAVVPLAVLSACGVVRSARRDILLGRDAPEDEDHLPAARPGYLMLVPVGLLVAAVGAWPNLASWFAQRNTEVKTVVQTVERAELENALVLLDDLPRLMCSVTGANSPDLDDAIVFAKMLPDGQWRGFVARFPDRQVYVLRLNESKEELELQELAEPPENAVPAASHED